MSAVVRGDVGALVDPGSSTCSTPESAGTSTVGGVLVGTGGGDGDGAVKAVVSI